MKLHRFSNKKQTHISSRESTVLRPSASLYSSPKQVNIGGKNDLRVINEVVWAPEGSQFCLEARTSLNESSAKLCSKKTYWWQAKPLTSSEFFSEVSKQPETKQKTLKKSRVQSNYHLKTCVLPDNPLNTWESEAGGSQVLTLFTYTLLSFTHIHTQGQGERKRGKDKGREGQEKIGGRRRKRGRAKGKGKGKTKESPLLLSTEQNIFYPPA